MIESGGAQFAPGTSAGGNVQNGIKNEVIE
jgi:hypothetical protein